MSSPARGWRSWPARERASHVAVPSLLFAGALAINVFRIDAKSLGLDETTSVYYAAQPLGALATLLSQRDPNMSVYYVMLRGWMSLFGQGEVAVRSLSAVAAALAVPAIYFLGQRLFGRPAGLLAAVLLMLNAFIVEYAQTARSYAVVMLFVILASMSFVLELERPSKAHRVSYVVFSTLAFYSQYFAGFVVAAHALVLLATRGRAGLTRARLGTAVVLVLLWSPEVVIAARVGASTRLGWVLPPSLEMVHWALVAFAGHSSLALLLLVLLGIYGLGQRRVEGRSWPHLFVAAWFVVPVVATLAISLWTPVFVSRFLIVCVPALILFGVGGLASIRSPGAMAALVGVVVWSAATRVREYYGAAADEDWRGATQHVLATARSGDGITFFPDYNRRPFDFYARLAGTRAPENLARQPLTRTARVWLVDRSYEAESRPEALARLRQALGERYRLIERRQFANVGVELYELRAPVPLP